ncbi:hypothetical protein [Kineosporia sp. NBRC 101731]|uniref:hypothetical protein n=1 Tax=Kineosporia sp. NBRC 101731 TaxID=3032199 RepID=UPI0024A1C51E|nr:hypothetical protein [Kineosporia sp. NBRC 101731]GLY28687.1 hypothetical protein Kisp02_20520 [Kineosporia sp. NBRC 101731]
MTTTHSSSGSQTVTVGQVLHALRRRVGILLLCTVAGGLLAAAWSTTASPSYSAGSVVKLASLPDNPLTTSAGAVRAVNPATEAEVVTSSSVAAGAADLMKSDLSAADLISRVKVTNPADSQVLRIAFTATSPERAAQGANAFAQAYLNYRADAIEAQINALDKELSRQIDDLTQQQEEAQNRAITSTNEVTRANAKARVTSLSSVLQQLRGQRAQLGGASRQAGEQVGSAQPPSAASGIGRPVLLVAGLAIGLVGGLVLALLRDRTDQRVRDREQVESELGPVIITEIATRRGKSSPGTETEALRRLGAVVAAPLNAARMSPVLVMPVRGNDSSDLVAKLTEAVGTHTRTVLLCAADAVALNGSALEFSPNRRGLVRSFGAEDAVKAGTDLTSLAGDADVVLVDGINVTDPSTALMLAPSCSAVLLVIRRKVTRLPEITATVRELRHAGAQVHGVILLPSRPARRAGHPVGAHVRPMPLHESGRVADRRTSIESSVGPSVKPSDEPSVRPSAGPSGQPSVRPSTERSTESSTGLSVEPAAEPSTGPSVESVDSAPVPSRTGWPTRTVSAPRNGIGRSGKPHGEHSTGVPPVTRPQPIIGDAPGPGDPKKQPSRGGS